MTRSGAYVQQLEGYKAFIPTPLPPNPPIRVDEEMLALLSKAYRSLGRLDGSIQASPNPLPNPDLFVFMYVKKEAVLSSQIEGTQASINDILEAEANIFRSNQPNDIQEVINYIAAMNLGRKKLTKLPMSIRLVKEIHARLMEGVRGNHLQPGEIRQSQNWIGASGMSINSATFVPPPPSAVMSALSDFEKFLHPTP